MAGGHANKEQTLVLRMKENVLVARHTSVYIGAEKCSFREATGGREQLGSTVTSGERLDQAASSSVVEQHEC